MLPSFTYVTDHLGFRGTIKTAPGDFVVTEMEAPAQEPGEAPLAQGCPCPQQPKKPRAAPDAPHAGPAALPRPAEPSLARAGCCLASLRCGSHPEPTLSPGEANTLDSLLGKPLSELLNQFACELQAAWDSADGSDGSTREFSLGPVLDKKKRAALHSAIRQEFPFLVAVTKGSEMTVRGNADYKELCQLVSEKEAKDFFKFLDAKLENSTFSFEPDGNKEHRKAIHHFISRKFGKLLETKSFTVTNVNDQPNMSIIVRFRERSWSKKRPIGGLQENQELYTAFTLQKENLETLEAIGFLASELGILASDFSYTGIKDKKAITYQPMVVKKVTPERY
uniref:PUS7L protein n=1 Tax=Nothoprocta perdicaria TaxID=30464 RepID=A0A8C7EAW9_NOTPE